MKVMHFVHGLCTGGAETLVKDYMLNFDRKRFDMVLLCLKHYKESPYEKILDDNGVRVVYVEDYLPFRGRLNIVKKTINHVCRYLIVRRIIRKESPDVLHSHLALNDYVKFARPGRSTKIFHTVHSEPEKLWLGGDKAQQKDFKSIKWLVKHYDVKFIVLHDEMGRKINKMFGVSGSVVLNNGINLNQFGEAKDKKLVRKELNIPLDAFVVGHVGRLSSAKNQDFLVDIFIEIEKRKDAFLLMVGDGLDKNEIVRKLDKNSLTDRYLIVSNRNDVPDLLGAMDVFIFPSKYEGLGIALIEAQEAKLPCFISEAVPEHAVVSNLVTRLQFDVGADGWAKVIMSYKKPKNVIVNDADWDIKVVVNELEELYMQSLGERDER